MKTTRPSLQITHPLRWLAWVSLTLLTWNCADISYQKKGRFEVDGLLIDNRFDGARMSGFSKVGENTFEVLILPENRPINPSPWYSFKLWTKEAGQARNVILILKAGENDKPRYIPKLSRDGKTWQPIDPSSYRVDTVKREAYLNLTLDQQPLWVGGQESFPSQATYDWADSLAAAHHISPQVIGKSTLGRKLIALSFPASTATPHTVIFAARQHPPEITGGVIGYQMFMKTIMGSSQAARKFRSLYNIIAIPMVNPDGIDLGHWRHNAHGKDLNRDWYAFEQPETQSIRSFILKRQSEGDNIVFGIDFHSSYTSYMLSKDTSQSSETYRIVPQWYRRIRDTWPDHSINLKVRPNAPTHPYLHNWFYTLGADGVTYEEADETPRPMIRERARRYAETLMHTLNRMAIKN